MRMIFKIEEKLKLEADDSEVALALFEGAITYSSCKSN